MCKQFKCENHETKHTHIYKYISIQFTSQGIYYENAENLKNLQDSCAK